MKILLVLSGKGGVGKSTFCAALAAVLSLKQGKKIGILDADLCGPSLPGLFPQNNRPILQSQQGWIPLPCEEIENGSIRVISIGYLLSNSSDAIVWRGPKKTAMLKQMFTGVAWGDCDFLIIDTPPGTSDEHITLAQLLADDARFLGAIVISTPQFASLSDVQKELEFCKLANIACIGLVENMRDVICEHCGTCTSVFGSGEGVSSLASHYGVPFLGSIPLDPKSLQTSSSHSFITKFISSSVVEQVEAIASCL
ncbi:Nucleotide-binding protein 2 [Mitosporidium daphniae]